MVPRSKRGYPMLPSRAAEHGSSLLPQRHRSTRRRGEHLLQRTRIEAEDEHDGGEGGGDGLARDGNVHGLFGGTFGGVDGEDDFEVVEAGGGSDDGAANHAPICELDDHRTNTVQHPERWLVSAT